jgi:hypothetical protein
MKIQTQWGTIAYDPQTIACDADILDMADAAFGEHAGEWLEHRTGYRPGMTCAQVWVAICGQAIYRIRKKQSAELRSNCAICGGTGMTPGTKPDDDVMNAPCPECNPQPLP